MYADIGLSALALAWLVALYGISVALWQIWRPSAFESRAIPNVRLAVFLNFALLLLASGALLMALLSQQYELSFVWETTAPETPTHLRISAIWGGQRGSLLFWSLLMSAFAAAAAWIHWSRNRPLMIPALLIVLLVIAFFSGLVLFSENPFARYWLTEDYFTSGNLRDSLLPPAGLLSTQEPIRDLLAVSARGGSSLLRHPAMLIHPPLLYLGFVGMVMPFSFAVAALIRGEISETWVRLSRRWLLLSWLSLGAGLLLGGRWAYDVLGWGGYWGWDPVENAALLPWLAGTALLHSLLLQEKRGIFKTWNFFLVTLVFSSVLFATFATRSGLVESVHSFARSEIGWPLFFFWSAVTAFAGALIIWRGQRGEIQITGHIQHWGSREFFFVLNNMLFTALIFAIFWGSFGAPLVSELLLGQTRTLRVAYFEQVSVPLFIAIFFLMGVAPLASWGTSNLRRILIAGRWPLAFSLIGSILIWIVVIQDALALLGFATLLFAGSVALREWLRPAGLRRPQEGLTTAFWRIWRRDQSRLGGYLVHLGVVVIGFGIAASSIFQQETQQTLLLNGPALQFAGYELRYLGAQSAVARDGRRLDIAQVEIARGGEPLATIQPRLDYFPDLTLTVAGVYRPLAHDLYVLLIPWQEAEETGANLPAKATFKIYLNPLVGLVWWGGLLLAGGTWLSGWAPIPKAASLVERKAKATQMPVPVG